MKRAPLELRTTSTAQPRRFVYRSAMQEDALSHPLRRATDVAPPVAAPCFTAQPAAAVLLEFRAYLELN